ncbi:class I SAM-dependent methyltransferase [Paenibacillus tepidiphilus]|uniref:class I SAM-dependent methyltransferase n=1 Tax=Paenibacillus tepidiphilus TaxID=2608683 RepID=UPI001239A427|nr:class I SAM-dependent methyltransferase [Paenibacillus tepidiphilus]
MKPNESSITSMVAAFGRAYHSRFDEPKIFDDYIAVRLISEQEFAGISGNMIAGIEFFSPEFAQEHRNQPDEILRWITQVQLSPTPLARAAYCESVLLNEMKLGAEQYVILGAGLDSFAYRHPELGGSLEILEVDHPATQQFKQERLAESGLTVPDHLHFVPMDFTRGMQAAKLAGAGKPGGRRSFFSLLGVSYYLTKAELGSMLQQLFADVPAGSSIVLDYADDTLFETKGRGNRVEHMVAMAAAAGEPMKSGYAYTELEELLAQSGLLIYEHLNPEAIQERYFQGRSDYLSAFETIHYIHAVKAV